MADEFINQKRHGLCGGEEQYNKNCSKSLHFDFIKIQFNQETTTPNVNV